jgi:hypothetical protein
MGGNQNDDDELGSMQSMAAALVGGMKEMRLGQKDLLEAVTSSASAGWKLAGEALKSERKMAEEKRDLELALALTGNDDNDPTKQIMAKVANDFVDVMKAKAFMAMQQEAAKPAAVTDTTKPDNG